jgi:hypothetical protein
MPRNIMERLMGSTAIYREPDLGAGNGGGAGDTPAGETPAGDPPIDPPAGEPPAEKQSAPAPKVSDTEAKLLKEVMKHKEDAKAAKEAAKAFEGIDPAKARAALAAQAEAERKELEARGEYDRIIQQVRDQANTEIEAARAAADELRQQLDSIQRTVEESNVRTAFATSPFIRENLVISGEKVRVLYGTHFDIVDGDLVGYDKPRGEKDRTPLVGPDAKPLSFEAAVEKVVKADPEWERLGKSKMKPGSGSTPGHLPATPEKPQSGTDRIRAGLSSLARPTLNLGQTRR